MVVRSVVSSRATLLLPQMTKRAAVLRRARLSRTRPTTPFPVATSGGASSRSEGTSPGTCAAFMVSGRAKARGTAGMLMRKPRKMGVQMSACISLEVRGPANMSTERRDAPMVKNMLALGDERSVRRPPKPRFPGNTYR